MKLTDKEVLKKAIEIAIKNGYKEPFVYGMGSSFSLDKFQIFKLYFSHDFAKAFWKPRNYNEAEFEILRGEEFWKHHLKEMVLEKSPIDYLRKFIEE